MNRDRGCSNRKVPWITGLTKILCRPQIVTSLAVVLLVLPDVACAQSRLDAYPIVAPDDRSVVSSEIGRNPFYGAIWGTPPTSAKRGHVVTVEGRIGGEPFRLWFFSRRLVAEGVRLEVAKDGPGQLTVGSPLHFVSNEVEISLVVSEDGRKGELELEAHNPELDERDLRSFEFDSEVDIGLASEASYQPIDTLPPRMRPFTSYQPDRLWNPVRGKVPPEGYEVRRYPRRGMLVAGAALFGSAYLGSIALSAWKAPQLTKYYAIPMVGPNLALAAVIRDGYEPFTLVDAWVVGMGTVGVGLAEAVGLALVGAGLAWPRIEWERNAQVTVVPMLAPKMAGSSLLMRF